jgi:hypothetical protein
MNYNLDGAEVDRSTLVECDLELLADEWIVTE